MSDQDLDRRVADHTRERFHANTLNIAERLRNLAERIEHEAAYVSKVSGTNSYDSLAGVSSRITHEVAWGVANLNIDGLVTIAHDFDMLPAEAKRPQS